MSLNGFAHSLVYGFRRETIDLLIAASAASFQSSQNRCVVAADVMRHLRTWGSRINAATFLKRSV
jgi:hypothetical protein